MGSAATAASQSNPDTWIPAPRDNSGGSNSSLASGFSIAGLGLGAAGDVMSGYAKQQEYGVKGANYLYQGMAQKAQYGIEASRDTMQADMASRAADFGKLQAGLTDVTLRENATKVLGNIEVIRSAGHVDPSSPTTSAVEGFEAMKAERQRTAAELSINSQVAMDEASATYLRSAASFALGQGNAALAMGEFNADAASQAGDTAVKLGWLKGATDVAVGIGNAAA